MEVVDTTQINSFASSEMQADVSSENSILEIPASTLQELLGAIQSLQDVVEVLQATVAAQDEKISELSARVEAHSRKIYSSAPAPTTEKTQEHITEIAYILANKEKRLIEGHAAKAYVTKLRREGMTFSQLAQVMGLTVDRIRQLSRVAATDQRFNITWHPRKKNTKIIKLRRWDAQEL